MLAALVILLICGFTVGVNLLVTKLFELKIARTPIARKAVRYRVVFNVIRVLFIILFVGMVVLFFYTMGGILFSMDSNVGAFILISIVGLIIVTFARLKLPIHAYTKEDVKEKDFVLYLRGFRTDTYDISSTDYAIASYFEVSNLLGTNTKKEPRQEDQPFSEERLAKVCGKTLPVYCVGQPGEVYSPHGCKRVYLDHATWKEDVADLINKAKYVVVLLHDSENCIWEILQCSENASQKTIFLIEDIYSFNQIVKSMQGTLPEMLASQSLRLQEEFDTLMNDLGMDLKLKLEEFSNAIDKQKSYTEEQKLEMFTIYAQREVKLHCAIYMKQGQVVTTRYKNTPSGLRLILDDIKG